MVGPQGRGTHPDPPGVQGACLPGSRGPPSREASTCQPPRRRPGRESPVSRAVQGSGTGPCSKKFPSPGTRLCRFGILGRKSWGESFGSREGCPPKGVLPDRAGSRTRREFPFCLRGAWDFGWLGPDLSLASEPAWQVRWLARVGRPRARLGVRPRDGPGCGFRWLVRVGRPRGSGARLWDLPPATGTSATSQATDHLNPRCERGREPPGKIKLQTHLAYLFRGARPRTT